MVLSVLLFALALTRLDLVHTAQCPQVTLVKNFDITTYAQGTWYEIGRYKNNVENYGNCVRTNYTKRGDNDFIIEVDEIENKKHIVHDGILNLSSDDHRAGIVNYVFQDSTSRFNVNITFLAVDYNSYAIKYFCKIDPQTGKKSELAWVLSRTKILTSKAKSAVDSFIETSGVLDKNQFFWDQFSDDVCKYDSSVIYRRLPQRYEDKPKK